ncbi:MAG: hypothetical protein LBG58_03040 [Planctomycetaceae bacterium]|nr:hypothetical protein [Planctomycetaceae bacterium]
MSFRKRMFFFAVISVVLLGTALTVGNSFANEVSGREALSLINQRLNGNYTWSDTAYASAVRHAAAMASAHRVFHSPQVNEVQECCVGGAETADDAVRIWQNSPPHRAALIRNAGNRAAVAVVDTYWCFQLETPVTAATVTKTAYTAKNVPVSYEKEVSTEQVPKKPRRQPLFFRLFRR